MNLLIITGSHRLNSQSIRIANLLKENFTSAFSQVKIHELAAMKLPFWDEGVWKNTPEWSQVLGPIRADAAEADAFVFVAPEWSGMVPAMLKNYFLLMNNKVLGQKPALIVSISSGMGGAYPVHELRTSSYKNTKLCYIPDHVIIRNVKEYFVDEANANLSRRIKFSCDLLFAYAERLKGIKKLDLPFDEFAYGM